MRLDPAHPGPPGWRDLRDNKRGMQLLVFVCVMVTAASALFAQGQPATKTPSAVGQAIAYARVNHIVPPWSQPQAQGVGCLWRGAGSQLDVGALYFIDGVPADAAISSFKKRRTPGRVVKAYSFQIGILAVNQISAMITSARRRTPTKTTPF